MGFLGRSKASTDTSAASPDAEKADGQPNVTSNTYDSDSAETSSLEAQNEKEIQQHPNEVTSDAHLGVKKVEAAALVWGKPALIFTYGWYRCKISLILASLPD